MFLDQSPYQATSRESTQREPEKKSMRDSRIINHIGGRRRWENEMAKENWTEEKHAYEKTSKGEEETRGSVGGSISSVVYGGDICWVGPGGTTAVTMSATVYRETGLLSKTQLCVWVNSYTEPFILLWHSLGLMSKGTPSLFPAWNFAMRHKTFKRTDRNQHTNTYCIINRLINLLKTMKEAEVPFSPMLSNFLRSTAF